MSQRTPTRSRKRNKPQLQVLRHDGGVSVALDNNLRPIVEARRSPRVTGSPVKSFSLAWDETEALGITADMRRSGPGMLSDQDRKETLYKAYLQSVWISACVDVIAKRVTSGGYVIEYIGTNDQPTPAEEAQKEELDTFLKHINDDDDFLALVRGHLTDLGIYGESYLEIVMKSGKPFELYRIDCQTMNYQLDKHGRTVRYIQNMTHSTDTVEFEPEEAIRWWLPDPKAGKKALSPIERILGSVDSDVHMADWARAFFRKGARPNFWIKFDGPKEEADRFVIWLRENYTGMANAHVPLILYDGAELYEIGKGSVDIDFGKGREIAKTEILAGYQVPPAIVSQIESGNIGGGTGESQEKSFLHNACDPLKNLFFEKFNDRVVKKGFGITCWRVSTRYADYRSDDSVSVILDREIRNGSLNINEVRQEMGKQPVDGGDSNVIITTREVTAVGRLAELEDEQRQQAAATIQHMQAQADLTQAQTDKLKEPPPPPAPVHVVAPVQPGQNQPPNAQQQLPPPANSKQPPQESALHADINRLIESLNARAQEMDVQERAERLLMDLLARYRHMAPEPEESHLPLASRINEALSGVEELRRMIQAKDVTPVKPTRTRRKKAEPKTEEEQADAAWEAVIADPKNRAALERHAQEIRQQVASGEFEEGGFYVEEEQQQHTGMMLAFMLDPETARRLAIPGGEPVGDLHCTLAFMGNAEDFTGDTERLKEVVSKFATSSAILRGKTSGIGRFTPSDSSDGKVPLYAGVDVPGLAEFRAELVACLEEAGFSIDKTHEHYVPHITLAYLPIQEGA